MKAILTGTLILTTSLLLAQKKEKFTVNFDFDKYEITKATALKLDSFALTEDAKTAFLGIYGHCDSVGNNDYNDELSYKRVVAVKRYLIKKGFSGDKIKEQIGFGKRNPLNSNSTEKERAANRRVQVIVNDDGNYENDEQISSETKKHEPTLTEKIKDTIATKLGDNVVLKNLNFYEGRSLVLPSSFAVLQELLDVMKKYPTLEIAIEGHICCMPNAGDGLDIETNTVNLSENRAKAVYTFLLQNNIKAERISYKGFGHQFPIKKFPETTEDERIENRRVEIKIIKR